MVSHLKINNFHHFLLQKVWFSIERDGYEIYLNCCHVDGHNVISVTFESGIPTELYWSSFKVPHKHLTEKDMENYILDWMITDAGSVSIKNAIEELINQYSEI
jgi:hypothetical protein